MLWIQRVFLILYTWQQAILRLVAVPAIIGLVNPDLDFFHRIPWLSLLELAKSSAFSIIRVTPSTPFSWAPQKRFQIWLAQMGLTTREQQRERKTLSTLLPSNGHLVLHIQTWLQDDYYIPKENMNVFQAKSPLGQSFSSLRLPDVLRFQL